MRMSHNQKLWFLTIGFVGLYLVQILRLEALQHHFSLLLTLGWLWDE